MSAADVHSILYRGQDPLKDSTFLSKNNASKRLTRLWPGKVPEYALEEEDEDENEEEELVGGKDEELQQRRIERLKEAKNLGETKKRERYVLQRAIEKKEEIKEDKILTQECLKDRDELRKINLAKRQEEEEKLKVIMETIVQVEEEEEEEDSDHDSESDVDDPTANALMKPIFVVKSKRETIKEKELQKEGEERKEKEKIKKMEERKTESHKLLVEAVRSSEVEEMMLNECCESDVEMPDDNDDENQAEEYELWKIRELKRIKREKEEAEMQSAFAAEIERRRRMTDEERKQDDKILDLNAPKKEVKYKLNFMQKYYHKGAFFQDKALTGEEPLYMRDYNAPVGEDKMNKKILPKVMRLRRGQFGRQGQVKHTHLVDVDTTDFSTPWTLNDNIRIKYFQQMAGVKGDQQFNRPSAKKK